MHSYNVAATLLNFLDKYFLQVKWAKENDEKVKEIGKAGREFVRSNLMPLNIFCYHASLIKVIILIYLVQLDHLFVVLRNVSVERYES